jgi:hypothetical protein
MTSSLCAATSRSMSHANGAFNKKGRGAGVPRGRCGRAGDRVNRRTPVSGRLTAGGGFFILPAQLSAPPSVYRFSIFVIASSATLRDSCASEDKPGTVSS